MDADSLSNGQLAHSDGAVLYGDGIPPAQGRLYLREDLSESLRDHVGVCVQKTQRHKTGLIASTQRQQGGEVQILGNYDPPLVASQVQDALIRNVYRQET